MKKNYEVSLTVVLLLSLFVLLYSCEVSGPDTDPDDGDDQITKTIVVENEDGDELSDFTVYEDGLENGSCSGEEISAEITREAGTELAVCIQADGYEPTDQTITFDKDGEVIITLTKEDGGNGGGNSTVTRSYEIRASGADTLVAGDLRRSDTGEILNDGSATGEITLPRQDETVELCSQPTYFTEGCETIVPTDDSGPIIIYVDRESVSVTVHTEDGSGSDIAASITVEDRGDNYTYDVDAGERTRDFPARSGSRTVRASKEGYNPDEETITAGADVETTLVLTRKEEKAACNDGGIDNDGDGVADENDGGCVDTWASTSADPDSDGFVYEPEDDNETLRVYSRGSSIYSEDEEYISEDQEKNGVTRSYHGAGFRPQVQVAVEITVEFTVLVAAGETASFLLEWRTGPDDDNLNTVNETETVTVEGTGDWQEVTIPITRDYFANGTSYSAVAIHKGGAKITIFAAERDDYVNVSAVYEPEEDDSQSKQLPGSRRFEVAGPTGDVYEVTEKDVELK